MTAISWKPAAAIALVVIVVAAGAFVLLRRGGGGTGDGELPGDNAHAGEVLFKYEASFTYRGSENNVPLMGYLIAWPCPTVDGNPALTRENLRWQLWGPIEGENGARGLELEVDNNNVSHFVGMREENFTYPWTDNWGFVHEYGVFAEPSHAIYTWEEYGITWKIDIQHNWDNLYPGEQLRSIAYFSLPVENENLVTLEEDNEIVRQENGKVLATKSLGWEVDENGNFVGEKIISISFQVKLSKKVGDDFVVVRSYSRELENISSWMRGRFIELYSV